MWSFFWLLMHVSLNVTQDPADHSPEYFGRYQSLIKSRQERRKKIKGVILKWQQGSLTFSWYDFKAVLEERPSKCMEL